MRAFLRDSFVLAFLAFNFFMQFIIKSESMKTNQITTISVVKTNPFSIQIVRSTVVKFLFDFIPFVAIIS